MEEFESAIESKGGFVYAHWDAYYTFSRTGNKVINRKEGESKKWPRTQDLEKIYEVNSAIFIASKKIYSEERDRVGISPYLLIHDSLQSVDVDWEEDFEIAERLYKY